MLSELKRIAEKARGHADRFEKNKGFSSYRKFLAKHGDALIAAVELAEAADREYDECNDQYAWTETIDATSRFRAAKGESDE